MTWTAPTSVATGPKTFGLGLGRNSGASDGDGRGGMGFAFAVWQDVVYPFLKQLAELQPQTLVTALVMIGGLSMDFSCLLTRILQGPWFQVADVLARQMHRFVSVQGN